MLELRAYLDNLLHLNNRLKEMPANRCMQDLINYLQRYFLALLHGYSVRNFE